MAPKSTAAPLVELLTPETSADISKPHPLRIIKRSQTVAGLYPSERETSDGSYESSGSPPGFHINRPLTVNKVRTARGRAKVVAPGTLKSSHGELVNLEKDNHDQATSVDPEATPKAVKHTSRCSSAGHFLRSQLHGRSSNDSPVGETSSSQLNVPHHESGAKDPERRVSRSKNFFLRTIGGRSNDTKHSRKKESSSSSSMALLKRLDHSRGVRRSSTANSLYADSVVSVSTGISPDLSKLVQSDMGCHSTTSSVCEARPATSFNSSISYTSDDRTASSKGSDSGSSFASPEIYTLSPQITVTPEVNSIDGNSCSMWVAVEITGFLRRADGNLYDRYAVREPLHLAEVKSHGRMYAMNIELRPAKNCFVVEIIGNLHDLKTIRAGETELILAKMRFGKATPPSKHIRESSTSDELISDLEHHLGDSLMPYLGVRLNYKHSGFLHEPKLSPSKENGMSMHITKLQSEAAASIKRRNVLSTWSPRIPQPAVRLPVVNPLFPVIEKHCSPEKAREIIQRLMDEKEISSRVSSRVDAPTGSSEETVKCGPGAVARPRADSAVGISMDEIAMTTEPAMVVKLDENPENDPARKIWAQMRRTSKSKHHRASVSADHFVSSSRLEEEDGSPSRVSSDLSTASVPNVPSYSVANSASCINLLGSTGMSGDLGLHDPKKGNIRADRTRLMETALKNKRSVGADTLRSIAPSVTSRGNTSIKERSGTVGGLGLSRGWNWGGGWW